MPFSSIFPKPAIRDRFKRMHAFLGKGMYIIPQSLEQTSYQNPTKSGDGAFQYGHRISLGLWEYLEEDPEQAKNFNSGMQSLVTLGGKMGSAGPYSFDTDVGAEVEELDVLTVNMAGEGGRAAGDQCGVP